MGRINLGLDDWGALEGRVIVYAKFKNESKQPVIVDFGGKTMEINDGFIFSTYNSISARDITEKRGVAPENIEAEIKKIEEQAKQFKKEKGVPENENILSLFKISVTFKSEDDVNDLEEDVLYVGEYALFNNCVRAVDLGENIYLLKLKEQREQHTRLEKKVVTISKKTHKDFISKEIKEELLKNYVIPFIDAQNNGQSQIASRLEGALVAFGAGSLFANDISELCKIIKESKKNPAIYLIQAYVEKIDAVHLESYERAGQIRDEIARFLKENPPQTEVSG